MKVEAHEAEAARTLVDPQTFADAVNEFIETYGLGRWLCNCSLVGPKGSMPEFAIRTVEKRHPGFLEEFHRYHREHPEESHYFVAGAFFRALSSQSFNDTSWEPAVQ